MSVRCGRESVSLCGVCVCVSSLSSPAALLSVCPFALDLLSFHSASHAEWKARQQEQMADREKSSRRGERKNTSPQNKILFLSFPLLCCFPFKERKKRDKNKLKEVGGCREAGLQGRQQDVLDILLSPAGDSETG